MPEIGTRQIELPEKEKIQENARDLSAQRLEAKYADRPFEGHFEIEAVHRTSGMKTGRRKRSYLSINLSDDDYQAILENVNYKLTGTGLQAVGLRYTGGLFQASGKTGTQTWDLIIYVTEG